MHGVPARQPVMFFVSCLSLVSFHHALGAEKNPGRSEADTHGVAGFHQRAGCEGRTVEVFVTHEPSQPHSTTAPGQAETQRRPRITAAGIEGWPLGSAQRSVDTIEVLMIFSI